MSITLVSNSYLDENSAKIRAKPVPWEVRAVATSAETRLLTDVNRDTNAPDLSPPRSSHSSRKLTARQGQKLSPFMLQMAKHTPSYTYVY